MKYEVTITKSAISSNWSYLFAPETVGYASMIKVNNIKYRIKL